MKIYQIKIDFNVTSEIKRYVYVYLLVGRNCWLIDSGVKGCQSIIIDKIHSVGKDLNDLKGIFLTHAHPDHIGTVKWFKEHTGCKIYASEGEEPWISNIDKQFEERPIPNFYNLAGESCNVDVVVKDKDIINLEDDYNIQVISTPGHSIDEVSYHLKDVMFIGDMIPVKGDIPIYIDKDKTLQSIEKINNISDITTFYPAWDTEYSVKEMRKKIMNAIDIINEIDKAIQMIGKNYSNQKELAAKVCRIMNTPALMNNQLFIRTVLSHC